MKERRQESERQWIIDFLNSNSNYFKDKEIAIATEARAEMFTLTLASLPEGWRARALVFRWGRVDYEYLSPEQLVFRSKKAVEEYGKVMGGYYS